jgi:hypothetical protein
MKKMLAIGMGLALVVSFGTGACKKKEQQPTPQAPQQMVPGGPIQPGQPGQPGQMPPGHSPSGPKAELKIVVPDAVKGKWAAVRITVEDKAAKKSQEYSVNLGGELAIPNSNLKVAVGEFLPDFKMAEGAITSGSNDLNNPAVRITVSEGGKEIHKGWLYSKFPTIHPFEHPKYGLALKEGVKKG